MSQFLENPSLMFYLSMLELATAKLTKLIGYRDYLLKDINMNDSSSQGWHLNIVECLGDNTTCSTDT
jgi:hypothetical protein